MDRFIGQTQRENASVFPALKSNMDRFIANQTIQLTPLLKTLKSNMDRFIAYGFGGLQAFLLHFKIQYG